MKLETFRGPDLSTALRQVRAALGEDAMIVHTGRETVNGRSVVSVVAAAERDVSPLRARLERGENPVLVDDPDPADTRPYTVALVGPTGAGKTTTSAKLALHADAFGGRRVGFLALDTYRVAALEQLQTYADIMGAPMEVAYEADDVRDAMAALDHCDVVIVDAPGRSPTHPSFVQWRSALALTRPHEVHLVLPATIHPRVGRAHRDGYDDCGLSHLVITKLDEMPYADGVLELARVVDLPVRWTSDGQDVPGHLRRGGGRFMTTAARAAEQARARLAG